MEEIISESDTINSIAGSVFGKIDRWTSIIITGYFGVYTALRGLVTSRFQHEKISPYETHGVFLNVSPFALFVAAWVYKILLDEQRNSERSEMVRKILNSILHFMASLAILSLAIVYYIPPKLLWLGYYGLVLGPLAYTFYDQMEHLIVKTVSEIYEWIKGFEETNTSLTESSV